MYHKEFKKLTIKGIAVVVSDINIALMTAITGDHTSEQKLLQAMHHLSITRSLINEYLLSSGNKDFTGPNFKESE